MPVVIRILPALRFLFLLMLIILALNGAFPETAAGPRHEDTTMAVSIAPGFILYQVTLDFF